MLLIIKNQSVNSCLFTIIEVIVQTNRKGDLTEWQDVFNGEY